MTYTVSRRAAALTPSITLAIDAKAKQMKAEGMDVVGFGAGEPDFATPKHIVDAAIKALQRRFYQIHARAAASRNCARRRRTNSSATTAWPTNRRRSLFPAAASILAATSILATCNPGDEVIIPAPYWLSYPEMVRLAEATPVILPTTDKTEFKVTPEQLRAAITPRTRLFILNSPSNPTGSLYTPEEIKALGDVCVDKGVLIMSDEIYEKLVYDGAKHASVASFSQRHYEHTISSTGWPRLIP